MEDYNSYAFLNTRFASEGGFLKNDITLSNLPIICDALEDSIPLFSGRRMYWCRHDSLIVCTDIISRDTVWAEEYLPSLEGQDYNVKISLIAIAGSTIIAACYPYLIGIHTDSGKLIWRMEFPYFTSATESLIYNNRLIVYALNTDYEEFLIAIDLAKQQISAIREVERSMPDFMISDKKLTNFVWGHNLEKQAAILEKIDTSTLKKNWSHNYTNESLVRSNDLKYEDACWEGKYMLYENQLIVPTNGKKLLGLNYADGEKRWEFQLNQKYSQTNGFDVKDDTLYLIDDEEYIKLDVENGEVKERINLKEEWKQAGLLYSTSNLCINGDIAVLGSIYEQSYGLIEVSTGTPFWTHQTDFQFDKLTPVLLDGCIFVYNMFEGKIEVIPID